MNSPFEIRFEFPLAHSEFTVTLRATATLHHSVPYYVVDDFRFAAGDNDRDPSILPAQEIRKIMRDGKPVWVHKDSQRESQLSIAMGKAIDLLESHGS